PTDSYPLSYTTLFRSRRIAVRVLRQPPHGPHDAVEAERIGVVHWPAAPRRKAVSGQVHDVDVGRALSDAFLEDLRSFVDEGKDADRKSTRLNSSHVSI